MPRFLPEVIIQPAEKLDSLVVPCPAEIIRDFAQLLEFMGKGRYYGKGMDRLHFDQKFKPARFACNAIMKKGTTRPEYM